MNARSALFDLYGDHLRSRGGSAPVASLVRLMAPLGVAPPAVRTAISRMVRQGWLTPTRVARVPGYELTPRAVTRLDEAARRIYRLRDADWDETWHVVVPEHVAERTARDRLRAGLAFLGYGQLSHDTWVSAHPSSELTALLDAEGVAADKFTARHLGDPSALVRRAWDLDGIAAAYGQWLEDARDLVAEPPNGPVAEPPNGPVAEPPNGPVAEPPNGPVAEPPNRPAAEPQDRPVAEPPDRPVAEPQVASAEPASCGADELAFATRSRLVHEWRKFLFSDPALPRSLLPAAWPGDDAAAFFDSHATRLLPDASRFVDAALTAARPVAPTGTA